MNTYLLPIRVYVEDTDAGGIVYYVNYLKFMERARTEFLRSLGFGKAGANREGYQFVVHSANVEYKKPAVLDDQLQVSAEVIKLRGASVTFKQDVLHGDTLMATAEIKIACVDGKTLRPLPIPDELAQHLVI